MSDNLSHHDAFYTGVLWGQNGTYVKPDEKYWVGGFNLSGGSSLLDLQAAIENASDAIVLAIQTVQGGAGTDLEDLLDNLDLSLLSLQQIITLIGDTNTINSDLLTQAIQGNSTLTLALAQLNEINNDSEDEQLLLTSIIDEITNTLTPAINAVTSAIQSQYNYSFELARSATGIDGLVGRLLRVNVWTNQTDSMDTVTTITEVNGLATVDEIDTSPEFANIDFENNTLTYYNPVTQEQFLLNLTTENGVIVSRQWLDNDGTPLPLTPTGVIPVGGEVRYGVEQPEVVISSTTVSAQTIDIFTTLGLSNEFIGGATSITFSIDKNDEDVELLVTTPSNGSSFSVNELDQGGHYTTSDDSFLRHDKTITLPVTTVAGSLQVRITANKRIII